MKDGFKATFFLFWCNEWQAAKKWKNFFLPSYFNDVQFIKRKWMRIRRSRGEIKDFSGLNFIALTLLANTLFTFLNGFDDQS